jgi:undecaprenyl-diphosphooligosaccharide---protein glycotransferase
VAKKKNTPKAKQAAPELLNGDYRLYLLGITIAFLFAFSARLYWYFYALGDASFIYNGQVMINSSDGYFFAQGARDILAGVQVSNNGSPISGAMSIFTAAIAKLLPFVKFETLMLFIPAVFGSMIVVPMVLIGKALEKPYLGFFAAIFASVAFSYYNRTMVGYFDDDMFAIPMPLFVLYFLLESMKSRQIWAYLGLFAMTIFAKWSYGSAALLVQGFATLATIYILIFDRKNKELYVIFAALLACTVDMAIPLKLLFAVSVVAVIHYKKDLLERYFWPAVVGMLVIAIYLGVFNPFIGKFSTYFVKGANVTEASLVYADTISTIRETSSIDLGVFGDRISGSVAAFCLSLTGLLLLFFQRRIFLVSLPMLFLGFMALKGGLRFTIYAVPIMAFGYAHLFLFLADTIPFRWLKSVTIGLFSLLFLFPNLHHIYDYKINSIMTASEADALVQVGKIAKKDDYTIGWWDYGYPIRYYANTKTHSDGGGMSGSTIFVESSVLSAPSQRFAGNFLREAIEAQEKMNDGKLSADSNFEGMLKDRNISVKEYQKYLQELDEKGFVPAKKTKDVYLYLPYRMLDIFSTVKFFSNIDLMSGKQKSNKTFVFLEGISANSSGIFQGSKQIVDFKGGKVVLDNAPTQIARFYEVGYDGNGKYFKKEQIVNHEVGLNVIYLPSTGSLVLADNEMFNSLFIQMFIFENYDKSIFKPVVNTPLTKVYKLEL